MGTVSSIMKEHLKESLYGEGGATDPAGVHSFVVTVKGRNSETDDDHNQDVTVRADSAEVAKTLAKTSAAEMGLTNVSIVNVKLVPDSTALDKDQIPSSGSLNADPSANKGAATDKDVSPSL